jgi:hypothetical protein
MHTHAWLLILSVFIIGPAPALASGENVQVLRAMAATVPAGTYTGTFREFSEAELEASGYEDGNHVAGACQVTVSYIAGDDARAEYKICEWLNGHCFSPVTVVIRADEKAGFFTSREKRSYVLNNPETGAVTDISKAPRSFKVYSAQGRDILPEFAWQFIVAADRGGKGAPAYIKVLATEEASVDGEGLNIPRVGGTCLLAPAKR